MDETLLCLMSLFFNHDIPAFCFVPSFLSLISKPHKRSNWQKESTTSIPGIQQLTLKTTAKQMANGLIISTINCPARVLWPSCESTRCINQGDLVFSPHLDACKTTLEPYIATIKMALPSNHCFQSILSDQLNIQNFTFGATREAKLKRVQLELTEIPDVRRVDPEILQSSLYYLSHIIQLSIFQLQLHSKIFSLQKHRSEDLADQ